MNVSCAVILFQFYLLYLYRIKTNMNMKKVILAASALLIGAAAFAQTTTSKSDLEFQKYIAKKISNNTNFAYYEVQGTITVKMNVTPNGVETVNLVSGLNPKLDSEVVEIIKNAPAKYTTKLSTDKAVTMVMPIRFVLTDN
jgi:outer membrane biosynthesis protein TonB